jgi:hypothetical protein
MQDTFSENIVHYCQTVKVFLKEKYSRMEMSTLTYFFNFIKKVRFLMRESWDCINNIIKLNFLLLYIYTIG